jgi:hypothetical protein
MTRPRDDNVGVRKRAAELVRQFASGRITNDEFEDAYQALPWDRATMEMFSFVWGFYDDLYEHRLRGRHRLSPLQRRVFARCVLFLRSELEYEWPKRAKWLWCQQRDKANPAERIPWWKPDELVLAGLPFWGRRVRELRRRMEENRDRDLRMRMIDDRVWPFRRMADYKAALQSPPYLAGI